MLFWKLELKIAVNEQLRGILSTFVSVSVLCVSYCCCCYKPAGQTVFGPPSPPSCQYWRVGKGAGALDLESTAEHDILSNGSDHYLQSFVRVPVIHVRHAKQGWFSFLVEGIVNPERFLLLFSLSFLITHTHTVGVASPPVSFSVKWDCGASGETETYLLGLFLFASKVRPTVRLLSCVSSCIRRGLTSAGAKLFASLLAAVMGH